MKMCEKKKLTKIDAQLILFKIESRKNRRDRQPKKNRKEKRYYYCKECEAYHLTSN